MADLSPVMVAALLGKSATFRGCPQAVLGKLAPYFAQLTYTPGQIILPPGESATLGVVAAGRASLRFLDGETETFLEELRPGDVFGELGLLIGGAPPITVVAEETCRTLSLQKEIFDQLLQAAPGIGATLSSQMVSRYGRVGLFQGAEPAADQALGAPTAAGPA